MTDQQYPTGSLKDRIERRRQYVDLPDATGSLDDQIIALETWLLDHHDRPRIAQLMRADDRVTAETRLATLRSQRDNELGPEAA